MGQPFQKSAGVAPPRLFLHAGVVERKYGRSALRGQPAYTEVQDACCAPRQTCTHVWTRSESSGCGVWFAYPRHHDSKNRLLHVTRA